VHRRAFLGTMAGGLLAAPLAAEAQAPSMPRVDSLPGGAKAVTSKRSEPSDTVISTTITTGTPDALEVPVISGGPSRTRTLDPLIKSQLLYQLS
jgi:hypothetical protein